MRRLLIQLSLLLVVLAAGVAVTWTLASSPGAVPDVAGLNDVQRRVQAAWPTLDGTTLAGVHGKVTVRDPAGRLLLTTSDAPPADALDAARQGLLATPVSVEGRVVAMVYLDAEEASREAAGRRQLAAAGTVALLVMAAAASAIVVRAHLRIVRPFEQLQHFAARVASGDLDSPLAMDRAQTFGAWTESFDLMRAHLAIARRQQREAQESKRTLVAQIGHDVRSPVASIAAQAELLQSTTTDPTQATRLAVILAKARHVDALVNDLFKANDDEVSALSVDVVEVTSPDLTDLIRSADDEGRVQLLDVPDCIVSADPGRLTQVFDNILANAAKYAGTSVTVTGRLAGSMLELRFADRGPGVEASELLTIFGRGVRGANAGDRPGFGLGLYTCARLMERMGGDISAENTSQGLTVTVGVPLA